MSAFKQLLASDIIVSPFEVNKAFTFIGGNTLTGSAVGIERYYGTNLQGLFVTAEATTGQTTTEYQRLVYNSAKQLYYSNYLSSSYGDPVARPVLIPGADTQGNVTVGPTSSAGRFDNYLQTTLTYARYYPTGSNTSIGVISIPSRLYGDRIKPGSFFIQGASGSLTDDGEGNLVANGAVICGVISYQHGLAIITTDGTVGSVYGTAVYGGDSYGGGDSGFIDGFIASNQVTCSFSSSLTLFETQYKCTIDTSEFNFSLNPSIISGSSQGIVLDFATSSYFNPYVTTVGLYNQNQELIAVGKLSQPLPTTATTDITVLINIDR